jgi:hypothetical protein
VGLLGAFKELHLFLLSLGSFFKKCYHTRDIAKSEVPPRLWQMLHFVGGLAIDKK